MRSSKKKKKEQNNKFGVFNGNIINNETLGYEQEFEIDNYKDDSLTITELKKQSSKDKKPENSNKNKKGKANYFIYKLAAYIIILLLIVLLIVWLVTK
ncbi:hypothetical protein [Spiroplasma endosymbiont of Atherix ibis]|uniref:hypothetical protein n=1 Tax=Spiroplasma endosymbiont of Atherix ibis TaxID=3066291 RepID=UPI0030CF3EAD